MGMLVCMLVGTVILIVFIYLFLTAGDELISAMLVSCQETQKENIKRVQIEMNKLVEQVKRANGMNEKKTKRKAKKLKKQMSEAQKLLDLYDKGKITGLDMIPVAGYRIMQLMKWDSTNPTIKKLYQKCCRFKEKKEAINYTYYLLGSLFGYFILGIGSFFVILGLTLAAGMESRGIIVALVAFIVMGLIGYIPYDGVNAIVAKREEEISLEFPQVVSKMALLTVAGMEVSQAWKVTSHSGEGTLYDEMERVLIDLDNNVSPTEAYSKFITRCDNKYTTKLATSIIQNISKGNAEIVRLFRDLNNESWSEHKHNARRMGEKIQAKLLIPTMLMFLGILVLVIVPVVSGFNF